MVVSNNVQYVESLKSLKHKLSYTNNLSYKSIGLVLCTQHTNNN